MSSEKGSQKIWQLKALGGLATWLSRSISESVCQKLRGRVIHRLQVRFLIALLTIILEGNELSLKLVIEPSQYLLLTTGILTVERCLLLLQSDWAYLIGLVVPSFARSCQQAFVGAYLRDARWLDTCGFSLR